MNELLDWIYYSGVPMQRVAVVNVIIYAILANVSDVLAKTARLCGWTRCHDFLNGSSACFAICGLVWLLSYVVCRFLGL